jgi:hypothetical protein
MKTPWRMGSEVNVFGNNVSVFPPAVTVAGSTYLNPNEEAICRLPSATVIFNAFTCSVAIGKV